MLYFQLRVTENKIWKLFKSIGMVISEGQISNIITKKHLDKFSEERKEISNRGWKQASITKLMIRGQEKTG